MKKIQRDLDESRRQHVEAQRRVVESQKLVESTQRRLDENMRRMEESNTGNGSYKLTRGITDWNGFVKDGENTVTLPPCTLINIKIGPVETATEKDEFTLHAYSGGFLVKSFEKITGIRSTEKWYGIQPEVFTSSVTFKLVGNKTKNIGVPVIFYYES